MLYRSERIKTDQAPVASDRETTSLDSLSYLTGNSKNVGFDSRSVLIEQSRLLGG